MLSKITVIPAAALRDGMIIVTPFGDKIAGQDEHIIRTDNVIIRTYLNDFGQGVL
jgi:hypothetical protein